MYSACLFCRSSFPAIDGLSIVAHGRIFAFDPEKHRAWVVCTECRGWSLLPFTVRDEIIDASERAFRQAKRRVLGENVGWAQQESGLELVRIGKAHLTEFAGWRYGSELVRRRLRSLRRRLSLQSPRDRYVRRNLPRGLLPLAGLSVPAGVIAAIAPVTAPVMATIAVASLGVAGHWYDFAKDRLRADFERENRDRTLGIVMADQGHAVVVNPGLVSGALLESNNDGEAILRLSPPFQDPVTVSGLQLRRTLRLALPSLNTGGASTRDVRKAVASIESAGGPESYVRTAYRYQQQQLRRFDALGGLHAQIRAGLEIAINESHERASFAGDLWLLEEEWRQAEELAAISDTLVPSVIEQRYIELVAMHRGEGRAV